MAGKGASVIDRAVRLPDRESSGHGLRLLNDRTPQAVAVAEPIDGPNDPSVLERVVAFGLTILLLGYSAGAALGFVWCLTWLLRSWSG
jgi:hypothetical protein